MKEIWEEIPGYEELYWVSNLGNIKSNKKQLKPILHHRGYYKVELSKNGQHKRYFVHRLIALVFIPNPENKPQVNHKDGNKKNNCAENLEWCTNLENQRHAIDNGLVNKEKRIQQVINMGMINRKPIEQYEKDGTYIRKYNSIKEASEITGINSRNICNCLSIRQPKCKSAGGYIWKYSERKE